MKITILGCGVMGSAFARQFAKKGYSLTLYDRNAQKAEELADEVKGKFISELSDAVAEGDLVLLAIKPKDLEGLAEKYEGIHGKIILSILVGVSLATLKKHFPPSEVVRSVPNLAITYKESVIALVDDPQLSASSKAAISEVLEGLGLILWTEEEKIDAISALAGSGPAFIISILEAMVDSGIAMGLNWEEALKLSLQTIVGSVALVKNHSGYPGGLRWKICSPAGTTIAGIKVFEESAIRSGLIKTFLASYQKNREEK